MSTSPDSALELATITKDGKPPKDRLTSAKQAEDIFWLLKDAAAPRQQRAATTAGMFNGNAPYNPQKMRQRGEAWMANFSSLEGPSRLENAKTPFYDLLTAANLYADCETRVSTETLPAAEATRIRSEHFHTMLQSYPAFHMAWWEMLHGFIGFNKGFLWWPRADSWHFECLPWQKVYFPDATGINVEKWNCFALEHSWTVEELWGFVKDEGAAKAAGYNVKQVIKAIRSAVPRDIASNDDPMALQQALKNSELHTSMASRTVQAASIFVKEFDGTWSRMMVTTESRTGDSSKGSARPMSPLEAHDYQRGEAGIEPDGKRRSRLKDGDWLYYKQDIGDNIFQIICPFIYEAEDGGINTVGGLGRRILSQMQFKDRMLCGQANNVLLGNCIILQAQTGGAHTKQGVVQIGGGVVTLPPGYVVQQSSIVGNVEQTLAVNMDLDRRLDASTGTYRPQFEKPSGNPETATAAQQRFAQATVLSNSAVLRFYVQADKFYDECYRRATLEVPSASKLPAHVAAREFQEACREDGLSKKQIEDRKPGFIRAMRTIGNGSPVMRQQTAGALAQVVPFLGPRGLDQWKEMYVSAYAGQQGVGRLLPKEDRNQVPTRDDYDAVGENADFQTGGQVLFADWQDHEAHARTHLAAGVAAIQAAGQGADPATPFAFLQTMMPHAAQHIQKIGRKSVRDELQAAYKQLAQGAKQVEQAAMQQMKQAQDAQGKQAEGMSEIQLKMAELNLKVQEMQAKMALQKQEADQKMALEERKLEHEIQLDDKRFEHEEKMATQELEHQAKKDNAELQQQQRKMTMEGQMMRQKMEIQSKKANESSGDNRNS